ncbi:MAG: phosphate ABC transporter permease PstA [Candidatus Mcinerneyibacterium aminivorans]|uniref:Phosphate transport system permease protein PstA n=1 Tax=Candidatus Mcinerneyibacterium aminivorans TaxID=2703815 RepID=A0A5D0MKR9_9BACT|nr:MAG: phosphate ABC transporter permease PstA [Candidatus Mcinerneyibacterium aminivorans]
MKISKRDIKSFIGTNVLRFATIFGLIFLAIFLYTIFSRGGSVISLSFLTEVPKKGMTEGGIYPAIIGTLALTLTSILIAFPIGLFAAIYLVEYAGKNWFVRSIRVAIGTLSAVPSIIFGLFGLTVFVVFFDLGVSILSGALTLAVMVLPYIIKTSEEALKAVPQSFREASIALGANKSRTILKVVLPTAFQSIITGIVVSIGRVAGETAPILFTAATFYTRELPSSFMDEVMALPYHIYALMTEGTNPVKQEPMAYGTAVVLLALVLIVSLVAIIWRYNIRRKKKW